MNIIKLLEVLALPPEKQKINQDILIFKDPTPKEINDLIESDNHKHARYAIDKRKGKKAVYLWPAKILHLHVAKQLGLPYPNVEIMYGVARKIKGKVISFTSVASEEYKNTYMYTMNIFSRLKKKNPDYKEAKEMYETAKFEWEKHTSVDWKNKWIDVDAIVESIKKVEVIPDYKWEHK